MSSKYKKYEETMVKVNNLKKKFILMYTYTGFGNKLFDCIIGIYLKKNFDYEIYYVDSYGPHAKPGDYLISQIFPKITNELIVIDIYKGDYIRYYLDYALSNLEVKSLSKLKSVLVKDQMRLRMSPLYSFVFEMYDTFDNKTKSIFRVNEKLIDKNILSYANTKYATIHIRYGDKLYYSIKKRETDKNFINYPIYTPEYYYEQIKIIKKLKLPIIILTDSPKLVKHFILEKYKLNNDSNIFMPDIQFLDSFFLICKSIYSVLSNSTFSYGAYLLSKDDVKNKTNVFCTIKEFGTVYKPYDLLMSDDWIIYDNKKYILNFNQPLLKEMIEYQEKSIK